MTQGIGRIDEKRAARRILPLLDLTELDDSTDRESVRRLCARAKTPFGPVAAVCIPAGFVAFAKELLTQSLVRVATVANFPHGAADAGAAAAETARAVEAGAHEVDVVFPYAAFLAGDRKTGRDLIRQCRMACRRPDGDAALLKIILETGQLGDAVTIRAAADDAIDAGADFIKTSTGKREPGASLPAATAMLEAIVAARQKRIWCGFKASGGIRSLAEATRYLAAAERLLGSEFLSPASFRFGASRLLDDLRQALGGPAEEN